MCRLCSFRFLGFTFNIRIFRICSFFLNQSFGEVDFLQSLILLGKQLICQFVIVAGDKSHMSYAIIINADMNVPMLPVWLPEQIIQTNTSIGQVLSSVEIDTSLVASHVTVLKNYPFIGMMGYAAGENPLSYPEVKYTMVLQLIHAAAKLVDFVILDCSTSMTNVFTPAAIEAGDVVIRILTPDLKGINYLNCLLYTSPSPRDCS